MPAQRHQDNHYAEDEYALGTINAASTHAMAGNYAEADTLVVQLLSGTPTGTTPTLNADLEDSADGINWNQVGSFAQLTAASTRSVLRVAASTPFASRLRLRVTAVGGTTPSFPAVTIRVASERSD